MGDITANFSWSEFECINRLTDKRGVPVAFQGVPPGGLVAVYPLDWRTGRGLDLARECQRIRDVIGVSLDPSSVYRPDAYNAAVAGSASKSQHIDGRAADVPLPTSKTWNEYVAAVYQALAQPGCLIRGLGLYPPKRGRPVPWIHWDIRPVDELVTWTE